MTEAQDAALGQKLAKVFGMKKRRGSDRYELLDGYGTKTDVGLARVVRDIVREAQEAQVNFWISQFKPRTKTWMKENLKRLKSGGNSFETAQEIADKIKALKSLLN
jgi:hypothetical protein